MTSSWIGTGQYPIFNRWRHTSYIHNLNYCPRANAFLCEKAAYRQHEWQYMHACFGQVQQQKWTIILFFLLVFWRWFAVVFLHFSGFTACRPKCRHVVICGGLRWFVGICGGLQWFAVVCLLVVPGKKYIFISGVMKMAPVEFSCKSWFFLLYRIDLRSTCRKMMRTRVQIFRPLDPPLEGGGVPP